MTMVGRWAHLRRKFDEAPKVLPEAARENSLALVGKRYCDWLFQHERLFADLSPDKRREERMRTSKPEMESFFAWADSCNAIPKSPVGKAVYYAQYQRKYLVRYLLGGVSARWLRRTGMLPLSTAKAERLCLGGREIKLGPHGKLLVEYVMSFVNDDIARWDFDMDYSGYVLEHFPRLETETPRLAAKIARTIARARERSAWMDDMAFAYALSEELKEFFGTPKLQEFY